MLSTAQINDLAPAFERLDPSIKVALSRCPSVLKVTLAALVIAQDQGQVSRLTAREISLLLEAAGVAVGELQVTRALARAGTHITRWRNDDETQYRVMTSGRQLVEGILDAGPIWVSRIEAGKPQTARKKLAEVLAPLSGLVRICDPYYGLRTFDSLALFPAACNVQFLTSETHEKSPLLKGTILDFTREHPNAELRILPPPNAMHDRYILSADQLLILGHGIKDIGNKDSFVIAVAAAQALDLLAQTRDSFDRSWVAATAL